MTVIKTGTLGPTWEDFELARMKREDEGVTRRIASYRSSRRDNYLTLEDIDDEE